MRTLGQICDELQQILATKQRQYEQVSALAQNQTIRIFELEQKVRLMEDEAVCLRAGMQHEADVAESYKAEADSLRVQFAECQRERDSLIEVRDTQEDYMARQGKRISGLRATTAAQAKQIKELERQNASLVSEAIVGATLRDVLKEFGCTTNALDVYVPGLVRDFLTHLKQQAEQKPAVPGKTTDTERLDFFEQNSNCELRCSGWDGEDEPWSVHGVVGNRNDRVWHLIAQGSTVREAIDAAMKKTKGG